MNQPNPSAPLAPTKPNMPQARPSLDDIFGSPHTSRPSLDSIFGVTPPVPTMTTLNPKKKEEGFFDNFSEGVAKGGLSTLKGLGTLGQKVLDQTGGRVVNALKGNGFVPTGATGGATDIYHKGTELEQKASDMLKPDNTGEAIGFATEKIAEFFIPTGLVKGATTKISSMHLNPVLESIARIGVNTAAPTAVSIAQQGEINKEVGKTAAISGAFSAVGEGMRVLSQTPAGQELTKWLTERLPGRKLNKIVKPTTKEFDFSKNPGQTVAKEGIVANTRGELLTKISERKQAVGQQIDDILTKAGESADDLVSPKPAMDYVDRIGQTQKMILNDKDFTGSIPDVIKRMQKDIVDNLSPTGLGAKDFQVSQSVIDKISTIDASKFSTVDDFGNAVKQVIGETKKKTLNVLADITTPLKNAKEMAKRTGDKDFFSRLSDLEEGLTKNFDDAFEVAGDKNLINLTPKEVQQLKIQIGKDTRWTGQAFDNDINKVRVAIYRALDDVLDRTAPGIDALNGRYAGLLTAEKALERSNKNLQRLVEIGLRTTGVGTITAGASFARGDSGPLSILKGVLGAAAFQALGSTPVQTRLANFYTKLTPENQAQFIDIIKNVTLGVKTSNEDEGGDEQKI